MKEYIHRDKLYKFKNIQKHSFTKQNTILIFDSQGGKVDLSCGSPANGGTLTFRDACFESIGAYSVLHHSFVPAANR